MGCYICRRKGLRIILQDLPVLIGQFGFQSIRQCSFKSFGPAFPGIVQVSSPSGGLSCGVNDDPLRGLYHPDQRSLG